MNQLPRYLRFARALALVGGMAACGDDPTPGGSVSDTVAETSEETVADTSASEVDTALEETVDCAACDCESLDQLDCRAACCVFVGPLPPPDLPLA